MPEISVIVPVYKVEPYLKECVDSILAQTFKDMEIILVDDGSPDRCGEICDEYAVLDERVRVIHKENGGLSDARNAGLEVASANLISFIDSDDVIPNNYFSVLYQSLKDSSADISSCHILPFEKQKETMVQNSISDCSISGRDAAISIFNMSSMQTIGVSSCNKLYKKYLFKNIRFPVGMLHEDEATTPILLYLAEKVVFSSQTAYYYRIREGSIMHSTFTGKRFDAAAAVESCISFLKSKNDEEILKCAYDYFEIIRSKLVVEAFSSEASGEIPIKYSIPLRKAIFNLHKLMPNEKFEWYLAKIYPNITRLYSYVRKLKSVFVGENT